MNTRRFSWMMAIVMFTAGCTAPAAPTAAPAAEQPPAPQLQAPTAVIIVVTATPLPLPTLPPAAIPGLCTPQIVASTIVNVRNGPTTNHSIIGSLNEGATRTVDGRNAEGTWWRIVDPAVRDGHGWVAASVTTSDCIPSTLPVINASTLPGSFVAAVTNVVVSVDPGEMIVTGCTGETDWFTATALVSASGPMEISYAFEIEGVGITPTRTFTFTEYGSRQISERFKPEVVPGSHWVRLWIEGLNMKDWEYQTRYKIVCE